MKKKLRQKRIRLFNIRKMTSGLILKEQLINKLGYEEEKTNGHELQKERSKPSLKDGLLAGVNNLSKQNVRRPCTDFWRREHMY